MTEQVFHWWEYVDFYPEITPAVEKGNTGDKVEEIQRLLKAIGYSIKIDGDFGPGTDRVVRQFQQEHGLVADGRVGQRTLRFLKDQPKDPRLLTQDDIRKAAQALNVDIPTVMAVTEIEARGEGFFEDDSVVILFERHIMFRQLKANNINPTVHEQKYPGIVNRKRGGYIGGSREHSRLNRAVNIHSESGYASASYGLFQIMGFHWELLGFKSAEEYAKHMGKSEANHLNAFVEFIKKDSVLWEAMRNRTWDVFARRYNGPAYAEHNYHGRLATAYDRHSEATKEASFIV